LVLDFQPSAHITNVQEPHVHPLTILMIYQSNTAERQY